MGDGHRLVIRSDSTISPGQMTHTMEIPAIQELSTQFYNEYDPLTGAM